PEGWDNQLDNEVIVNMSYVDYFRAYMNDYINWVTYYGADLGTLHINGSMGTTIKFGWNVSKDYDFTKIEPLPRAKGAKSYRLYGILGCEGTWVLYNALIDGSMFNDGHSIKSKEYLGEFFTGVTIETHNIELTTMYTIRSQEFYWQEHPSKFGAVSVAYKW
ncbi:unnamed protein product, partial [marine sediment metagenome]